MKKLITLICLLTAFAVHAQALVGFSKGSPSAKQVVVLAIADAKQSIQLAAYQLTSADVIKALVAAQRRGVAVSVVLDRTQANGDSQAVMVASGIPCRISSDFRIMHHKFMVIDDSHVQTGSFNYSFNADKLNAENALYLRNFPAVAARYKEQWTKVNASAAPCKGGGT